MNNAAISFALFIFIFQEESFSDASQSSNSSESCSEILINLFEVILLTIIAIIVFYWPLLPINFCKRQDDYFLLLSSVRKRHY